MEEIVDVAGQSRADARGLGQALNRCQLDGINRMEVSQEILDPLGPNPGNIREA